VTYPGQSPGFPPLDPAAQSAISAAQERLAVLTRQRVQLPGRPLSSTEKDEALLAAAGSACVLCGGIHPGAGTPACPRVATFELNGDGTVIRGSFWPEGQWDTGKVVFPADLAEQDEGPAAPGVTGTTLVLPDEMAIPHYSRMMRATDEWSELFPGLQCRHRGDNQYPPAGAVLEFRLTPGGDSDDLH